MTRTATAAAGALLALGLIAAPASAKQTDVTVSTPSAAPVAGVPWRITVRVTIHGRPDSRAGYVPAVYLRRDDEQVNTELPVATFHGVRVGAGTFAVSIVFPAAGGWAYQIPDPVTGDWYFRVPHVAARGAG